MALNNENSINETHKEDTNQEENNKEGRGNKKTENVNNGEGVDVEEDSIEWVDKGLEEEQARVELGLVGKLWTNRNINVNAFISTIKNVWQTKNGVDISNIGKNLFVFQFYHWRDKARVLDGQPWHFDRNALLLGEIKEDEKPSSIQLHSLPIWCRVYNLPFKGRLNINNATQLGNKIGAFIAVDQSGSLGIDKSIRIRVLLDVRRPLTQKVKIKMKGGKEEFFDVKYERLPMFSYWCGKIGQASRECDDNKEEDFAEYTYESWLKASPWKPVKDGRHKKEDEEGK
ncbi:ATP synthase epsilon chain [Bienertia sinuspersici]